MSRNIFKKIYRQQIFFPPPPKKEFGKKKVFFTKKNIWGQKFIIGMVDMVDIGLVDFCLEYFCLFRYW